MEILTNTDEILAQAIAVQPGLSEGMGGKARISVFGLGYVGAVSVACYSARGHSVIGIDPDKGKTAKIASGETPIVEPELGDLLTAGADQGLISAHQDVQSAVRNTDISFVCVGTPSREDGSCDTCYLEMVSQQIGEALRDKANFHIVAYRSTMPPGTIRDLLIPIIEAASGKKNDVDFAIAFHPEFLREATAVDDFRNPPKTVIGTNSRFAASVIADLYRGIDDRAIFTSLEAAEMIKIVDNTWHAAKVSFANEIGKVCKAAGVDSHEVMGIFAKDTKLNLSAYYMKPGFAFGGSCLPKDVRGITHYARSKDVSTPVLNSLIHSNTSQIGHALDLILEGDPGRVGILGLTFKAGTDDLRETPMLPLVQLLMESEVATCIYDPNLDLDGALAHHLMHAKSEGGRAEELARALPSMVRDSIDDVIGEADTLVVAHATEEFRQAVARRRPGTRVVDLIRLFPAIPEDEHYEGICW